jgi:hypothetical protein
MKRFNSYLFTYLIAIFFYALDQFSKLYIINSINNYKDNYTWFDFCDFRGIIDKSGPCGLIDYSFKYVINHPNIKLEVSIYCLILLTILLIFEIKSRRERSLTLTISIGLLFSGVLSLFTDNMIFGSSLNYICSPDFVLSILAERNVYTKTNIANIFQIIGIILFLFYIYGKSLNYLSNIINSKNSIIKNVILSIFLTLCCFTFYISGVVFLYLLFGLRVDLADFILLILVSGLFIILFKELIRLFKKRETKILK